MTSTGTPVETWTEWGRRQPLLEVEDCPAPILVAPHPDDGEGAYPRRGREARAELAEERREELVAAAIRLGLPRPWFLGLPDGEVGANESRAVYAIEEISRTPPPVRGAPRPGAGDGEPDHEAAGRAAAVAAGRTGAVFMEYPVRMWRWTRPGNPAVPRDRARRVPVSELELAMKVVALQCFTSQLKPPDGQPALARAAVDRLLAMDEIVFV